MRTSVLGFTVATSAFAATFATAAELPPIKTSSQNQVPQCATPGRMMAFIKARNSSLDPRFEKIAVHYMREGEALGLRWDYAIAQMAIETNYLSYKTGGGRPSSVKPHQNNFAGLGATGGGNSGESFADIQLGVRAHLQHLLHYAGDTVENAVAERTRKVQEWGVLKSFHARIKGPVTFKHLVNKWAMDSSYGAAIQTHADKFYSDFCKGADPSPELLAEARNTKTTQVAATYAIEPKREKVAEKPSDKPAGGPFDKISGDKVSGADLARRAIEDSKFYGSDTRFGLGATKLAKPEAEESAEQKSSKPLLTVLNAPRPEAEAYDEKPEKGDTAAEAQPDKGDARSKQAGKPEKSDKTGKAAAQKPAQFLKAAAALNAATSPPLTAPAAVAPGKCRVFTASYGGQKSIIIRAQFGGSTNYTVLDVNDGAEKREADAYIAAYAKGGEITAEFTNQTQALDKAFELCPES